MERGIFLITHQFMGFMMYPLPMAGIIILTKAIDYKIESQIWMLSKSMGMKELPWLLACLTVYSMTTIIMGSVFCIFAKFYVFTKSSLGLLMTATFSFTHGTLFQLIFIFIVGGQIGLIIYGVLFIIQMIAVTVLGFITMIPSNVTAPLSVLFPLMPFSNILQSMLLL